MPSLTLLAPFAAGIIQAAKEIFNTVLVAALVSFDIGDEAGLDGRSLSQPRSEGSEFLRGSCVADFHPP
jgi:hypothetical protein